MRFATVIVAGGSHGVRGARSGFATVIITGAAGYAVRDGGAFDFREKRLSF